jgi:hypothetical protein
LISGFGPIADLGGYANPPGATDDVQHPGLRTVNLLLTTEQLKEAEEQVAKWKGEHGDR